MKVVRKINRPDYVNITSSKELGHGLIPANCALSYANAAAILCNLNTQTLAKIEKGHPLLALITPLKWR